MRNNTKVRYERINVNLLHSGLAYQRKVTDTNRIMNIASKWDQKLFRNPCVSYRNGMYNVIDGQNTIAAYKIKFGDKSEIQCKVAYDLTEEEESEWFYELENMGKPQALNAMYNARLCAKDIKLLSLIKDLNSAGLLLKINIPSGNNVIDALVTIEEIYENMNNIDFISCFKLLHDTWNGDFKSLSMAFIRGMHKFYITYKNEFSEDRFKKALSRMKPDDIKSQADHDKYTKKNNVKYAKIFVEYYNFNLKKIPTLKASKLDD